MKKANENQYELINGYFKETGWSIIQLETTVLVPNNRKELAEYFGIDTSNLYYYEILDSLDLSKVWYDSESCKYYVID